MGASMFSQLLPGLGIGGIPLVGGPTIAPVPKAQQNVSSFPGIQAPRPPYVDPAALMTAFSNQQNVQSEAELRKQQAQLFNAQVAKLKQEQAIYPQINSMFQQMLNGQGGGAPTDTTGVEPPADTGATPSSGSEPAVSSITADATLPREARALLDSIAGPESSGAYNIRYDGGPGATFDDFSAHPQVKVPITSGPYKGQTSDAAGRYQFLSSTFNPIAQEKGLQDFSPVSQDQAAWTLAQQTYQDKTGRPLLDDLHEGRTQDVASALGGQWPTIGKAMKSYQANLAKYSPDSGAATGQEADSSLPPVPDFTGAMMGNQGAPYAPTAPQVAGTQQPPTTPQGLPPRVGLSGNGPNAQLVNQDTGQPLATPPVTGAPGQQLAQATPAGAASPIDQFNAQARARLAQGNVPGVAPPNPAMGGYGTGGAINPRNVAVLGAMMTAAGLPNVAPPLQTYLYNDPRYKAAVAGATTGATEAAKLPYVGPTTAATEAAKFPFVGPAAAATARAKFPYEPQRPGSALPQVDAQGNPTGQYTTAPIPRDQINPDLSTSQVYTQLTPQGATVTPVPGVVKASPGAVAVAEASGKFQGEEEQKQRQQNINDASGAQAQQATLRTMQLAAPNFYTGPFADHVQDAKALIRLLPGGDAVADSVASYESFNKNMGFLTRQAVRDTSPRAAVQEFKLIANALPNPEMSPQGLQRVLNEFQGLNDYKIAKSQAQNLWEQRQGSRGPGDVTGFETNWQGQVSPYAFVVARMAPQDRQMLFNQVGGTNSGQAELQHLQQQIQFIQKSGLDRYLQ